ncbi:MAG: ribonuclease H family protein [Chloroflexi bacterium]|nr:ribonuclease H family protein [Chloroflexota bacterium]
MAKPRKFYVVWTGRSLGVFDNWAACEAQVKGVSGARFMSFETRSEAERAFGAGREGFKAGLAQPVIPPEALGGYAVDAACNGSPGDLEYRCVKIDTRDEIFHQGPFEQGTNNVGEFLVIVHALALFKKQGITAPLYSDSRNALSWVWQKTCKTNLVRTTRNASLFELIARAEAWLRTNTFDISLRHWKTSEWGENPADFGRK